MGWLRKLGRKIKKNVKKLFSTKLGSFIGSIGLSMMMGPLISKAFNGIKGVFTGTVQKGAEVAVEKGLEETVKKGVETSITEGATNGIISDTVSGAVEQAASDNLIVNDLLAQAQKGLKGEVTKAAKFDLSELAIPKPSAMPSPTLGQEIGTNFADLGRGVKEFASDPFGKTKEYIGEDFIPDVVSSAGKQYVMEALQGEPEQPFYSKGVQQVGSFEPAQASYMAEVQTQMPNLQATNFQQLNQSLLYGTLSPQYLMGQAQYS